MPKNHDYVAPEVEKRLAAKKGARVATVAAIEKLPPIDVPIPHGEERVEIAGTKALGSVVDLLGGSGSPFTTSYKLEAGVHRMDVRAERDKLFSIVLRVYPERGKVNDAFAADAAWLKQLDAIASKGDALEDIASPAFLNNHVATDKQVPKHTSAGQELETALRSILRGKATTVVLLDDAARRRLVDEVLDYTRANAYSNAGSYVSRDAFPTFNLDPQGRKFQWLKAKFQYSVYHEPSDGLWRISHYEGIVAPVLEREVVASEVLMSASDHTQTDKQKADEKGWRAEREAAQKRLDGIAKQRDGAAKAIDEADERIKKVSARIAEVADQVKDWDAYAKDFRAKNPILTEGEIAERIKKVGILLKAAEDDRDLQKKPAFSRAEKDLREHDALTPPVEAEALAQHQKQRERLAAAVAKAESERTDSAAKARELAAELKELGQWQAQYAKYVASKTPVPKAELEKLLVQQKAALDKTVLGRETGVRERDQADDDERKEGATLREAVARTSRQIETAPNRHSDWIDKLAKLSDAANIKTLKAAQAALDAGDAHPLPENWAERVTPKKKDGGAS